MKYDYKCMLCKRRFVVEMPMGEKCAVSCPKCKSSDVRRLILKANIVFKGSGFYSTDHKK